MTENMAGRGEGLAGLVARVEQQFILHRHKASMMNENETLANREGWARYWEARTNAFEDAIGILRTEVAALEAAAPAGTAPRELNSLLDEGAHRMADLLTEHSAAERKRRPFLTMCQNWVDAVRAALATPSPQAPDLFTPEIQRLLDKREAEMDAGKFTGRPAGFGPGEYYCAVCGMGMVEPCERWKRWFCERCGVEHSIQMPAAAATQKPAGGPLEYSRHCPLCGEGYNVRECDLCKVPTVANKVQAIPPADHPTPASVKFDKPIIGSDGVVQTGWTIEEQPAGSGGSTGDQQMSCPQCGAKLEMYYRLYGQQVSPALLTPLPDHLRDEWEMCAALMQNDQLEQLLNSNWSKGTAPVSNLNIPQLAGDIAKLIYQSFGSPRKVGEDGGCLCFDTGCDLRGYCLNPQCDEWKQANAIARRFHETYERLAPDFGYETRKESSVPWDRVPEKNRKLMLAVCATLLRTSGMLRSSSVPVGEQK